ncbi:DJ-1/PfpI family protein [Janibacter alittae]|uniref:DJ-1/PfpI family protein n=2 Tax=Janibacter alittae TaxID=3115209 RepID=A0ABZ2MGU9_9MICO
MNDLTGTRIAVLLANSGVEQAELTTPWQALGDAGARMTLIAPETGEVQAFNNDVEKGDTFRADVAVADANAADYDALVLPGGTTNADRLRMDSDAIGFITALAGSGTPIASICHGPWALVEAGLVDGRTLTSFPSLQTDIRNAGGTWVDEEAVTCTAGNFTLVTSRNPGDLDPFVEAAAKAFA